MVFPSKYVSAISGADSTARENTTGKIAFSSASERRGQLLDEVDDKLALALSL